METTNWQVITGAPGSGKSTVIRELEKRGFRVVHEAARAYIDSQLRAGRRLEEIRADELSFEGAILRIKVAEESGLPKKDVIFLDRAIPDSIAYYRAAGLDPAEPLAKSRLFRYGRIFLFEPIGYENDPVRTESRTQADAIYRLIEESYGMLDYPLVRVPPLPVEERVRFILREASGAPLFPFRRDGAMTPP